MKISHMITFLEQRKQKHGDVDLIGVLGYLHGRHLHQVEFDTLTVTTKANPLLDDDDFDLSAYRIKE